MDLFDRATKETTFDLNNQPEQQKNCIENKQYENYLKYIKYPK